LIEEKKKAKFTKSKHALIEDGGEAFAWTQNDGRPEKSASF
jgi:hypothetical protein